MRTHSGPRTREASPRRGAPGRPAGPQPAKRQAILEAAVAVFLREGYARASVDVIADEARVSKQTVYNHFGDKQTLFIAAVEGERRRVAEGFAPGAAGPDDDAERDARAALTAFGHRVLQVLLDERASALRRLVIAEVARHPWLRPACAEGEPRQLVSALAETLRHRDARGELSVPDPETGARQFVALLVQQGLHQSMYGTRPLTGREAADICEQAAELFVRAYRR
ncbi:TetR/AcrR family transcriptional regulator [Streptomyces sp. SAJ15]|uniref:TetR/AcrR family transcriptional regulator n=1 Tax=Streptomyces sp. SAJ15 TaxID=2011095 RepID=UPI0011865983|nr:TetR/AcrR family transcriptional regulator [Streptomyces sp. SAJ15]TVL94093.1 TetR family transcriptional regulator [Streptomyces sp. SAJ15]